MKYEIEIEGLPEGWEIEKCDIKGDISSNDASFKYINAVIRITKKQPRRIVLEDTGRNSSSIKVGEFGLSKDGSFYRCEEPTKWGSEYPVWRIVEDSGEKND